MTITIVRTTSFSIYSNTKRILREFYEPASLLGVAAHGLAGGAASGVLSERFHQAAARWPDIAISQLWVLRFRTNQDSSTAGVSNIVRSRLDCPSTLTSFVDDATMLFISLQARSKAPCCYTNKLESVACVREVRTAQTS